MPRVRIIKKNDEYSSEYDLGDIFEITGTWYGGVHIEGKSGVPVSLDKDEYMELDTEPQEQKNPAVGEVPERDKMCIRDSSNGMLNNEKFVSKAPAAKVQEEREKLEKYEQMLAQVKERLAGLQKK